MSKTTKKYPRYCNDFVCEFLKELTTNQVAQITRSLLNITNAEGAKWSRTNLRKSRERSKISSALTRQAGLARMTMGLIIRKYCKFLEIETQRSLAGIIGFKFA